jgi:hypothetical protein
MQIAYETLSDSYLAELKPAEPVEKEDKPMKNQC